MSKVSRRQKPPLEVNVMFEPHRLQHDLLQEAYAHLIPQSRRRLASGKRPSETPEASKYPERKIV
jgi:hypothetical protein